MGISPLKGIQQKQTIKGESYTFIAMDKSRIPTNRTAPQRPAKNQETKPRTYK